MPTLPDLFERLGEHGEHAGADVVVARAIAAARTGPAPVAMTADARPRRARRFSVVLTAAALTVALVAIPVALRTSRSSTHSPRPSLGLAYPPVASATVA